MIGETAATAADSGGNSCMPQGLMLPKTGDLEDGKRRNNLFRRFFWGRRRGVREENKKKKQ